MQKLEVFHRPIRERCREISAVLRGAEGRFKQRVAVGCADLGTRADSKGITMYAPQLCLQDAPSLSFAQLWLNEAIQIMSCPSTVPESMRGEPGSMLFFLRRMCFCGACEAQTLASRGKVSADPTHPNATGSYLLVHHIFVLWLGMWMFRFFLAAIVLYVFTTYPV